MVDIKYPFFKEKKNEKKRKRERENTYFILEYFAAKRNILRQITQHHLFKNSV